MGFGLAFENLCPESCILGFPLQREHEALKGGGVVVKRMMKGGSWKGVATVGAAVAAGKFTPAVVSSVSLGKLPSIFERQRVLCSFEFNRIVFELYVFF